MKSNYVYAVMLSMVSALSISARDIPVRSENKFEDMLGQSQWAVSLFFEGAKANRGLIRGMETLSKNSDYKNAGVYFLTVNVERNDLSDVASRYKIQQLPAVLLFENGRPVTMYKKDDPQKTPVGLAMLTGNFGQGDIRNLIDNAWGDAIRKAANETRRNRALSNYYAGPYVGFGWGYPGWGGYYGGWGYPGWGYGGWGFGRGYYGGWRGGYWAGRPGWW